MRTVITLLIALTLAAPAGAQVARDGKAAELKKVHILMVFDTKDARLKPGLEKDEKRMKWLWASTMPKAKYELTVLKDDKVIAANILGHYRKLKVGADEGVVLFYGGHGAIDPKKGPHFQLTVGNPLLRADVRKAMEATGAGLVALVSDCCSTRAKMKSAAERALPKITEPKAVAPTVRELFFKARGTIDVTGATNTEAWGDNDRGGLFTRAVVLMLQRPLASLDKNKDGALTWGEFFPQLRRETEILFDGWLKEMRSSGTGVPASARTQRPHAYQLGSSATHAVVTLVNGTGAELKYRWRWAGQTAWQTATLKAGEQKLHSAPLKAADATAPALETQLGGSETTKRFDAVKWTGSGPPGDEAAKLRGYRIRLMK